MSDDRAAALPPVRVLVVDDEPLARMRLEDLLRHETGVELVGTAENGVEAVDAIRRLSPDLVFLDVQMPGKTGIEVVREVGAERMPATIFVTAFDQYALQAFDVAAVDYLVKPFDDERFEEAFRRARRRLALEGMDRLRAQLLGVLQGTPAPATPAGVPNAAPRRWLERIAVEVRGKVRPVPVSEIDYITAAGPYAELHVGDRRHVIREAMQTLEERLDPDRFMRVHRSVIVRLDLVEALHRGAGGDYELQLRGGGRLKVSRSRREALERWLGVSS
ncbi:response regulator receiver [Gemmatirosa kalamazoonensis]|uniref:Response regulator receiver n=1 Tax=Gemmatirosa kalamazoonensis TaxID=861299 RepID=W0RG07_9BACT|nr:LytTR family DNA-binding domain-containing protein [Gemmatirosa kalamazoonensis]AHG89372.1 response regulator receiver [Gemmatirosa kalamazoonensis]